MDGTLDVLISQRAMPAALPGSPQYLFSTSSTNAKMDIRGLSIANNGASQNVFAIYHVPAGETLGPEHLRFPDITIEGKTSYEIGYDEGEWTLRAGDSIWGFASTTDVNWSMSGLGHE